MAIICKVIGKYFSREFLQTQLLKLWQLSKGQELIALGKGCYAVDCKSTEKCMKIMSSGPWMLQGYHIWTQNWEAGFRPSQAKLQKGIVWVNLPELPLEFYKNDLLTKIGNSIGQTIKIDTKIIRRW